jgi:gamma-glutamyltranspeptidase/glutathione hydrolase
VVAAGSPEAAEAGAAVLEEGGNAVDAAVAVSLVLGVTEPAGSGIGGQSTFLIHRGGDDPLVINGSSRAPAGVPAGATMSDLVGLRATTVPSTLKVLDLAWRRFGSGRLSWTRLVQPAVNHAEEGYPLGPFRCRALMRNAKSIRRDGPATQLLLAADGTVPEEGVLMRNPQLAQVLRRIAAEGAEDFYQGQIARQVAEDVQDRGGWLTLEDLQQTGEPPVLPALSGTYRRWQVHTLPPPAAGWVVLLALNLLEQAPEGELATEGGRRLCWIAEALTVAHRHRVQRPIPDLVHYRQPIEERLDKDRARRTVRALIRDGGETTHFSVADAEGTVVAVTQSLNAYFGARVVTPGLGFLYNDYMREFVVGVERHPFALRPGGMPYSSMSATILARDGWPQLGLGSPGDDRIISAVVNVASHWSDVRRGVAAAVAAPRVHSLPGEEVLLETRPADPRVLLRLEQRGYALHMPLTSLFSGELNPYFGGVHAVAREGERWVGAADPRRDGAVAHPRQEDEESSPNA